MIRLTDTEKRQVETKFLATVVAVHRRSGCGLVQARLACLPHSKDPRHIVARAAGPRLEALFNELVAVAKESGPLSKEAVAGILQAEIGNLCYRYKGE